MTTNDERIVEILRELRDAQKEHLAWSRDIMEKSVAAQQVAIGMQRRSARLYRIVVAVAAVVVGGMLVYLVFLTH